MRISPKISGIILCLLVIFSSPVQAAGNIQYYSPSQSFGEIIRQEGDKLYLSKEWYGSRFEINPVNVKSGLPMKPPEREEYQKALEETVFPLEKLGTYKVYFLNYRLNQYPAALALSLRDDSVVVFGSYYPIGAAKVHYLAVHELGHQVDFKLMDQASWQRYLELRGLSDIQKYNNSSPVYENRPQEIFAEDFRLLFGGETARKTPHLNRELPDPGKVTGLKEFFWQLAAKETAGQ